MTGSTARKLLSAIISSVICFGVMMVIVEEGPTEMPYYDGSFVNPVQSPNVEALYYTETSNAPSETDGTANEVAENEVAENEVAENEVAENEVAENESVALKTEAEYSSYSSYTSSSYTSRAE